jgi:hypothetical protein
VASTPFAWPSGKRQGIFMKGWQRLRGLKAVGKTNSPLLYAPCLGWVAIPR